MWVDWCTWSARPQQQFRHSIGRSLQGKNSTELRARLGMHSLLLCKGPAKFILAVVGGAQVDSPQPHQGGKEPQHMQEARHS